MGKADTISIKLTNHSYFYYRWFSKIFDVECFVDNQGVRYLLESNKQSIQCVSITLKLINSS